MLRFRMWVNEVRTAHSGATDGLQSTRHLTTASLGGVGSSHSLQKVSIKGAEAEIRIFGITDRSP